MECNICCGRKCIGCDLLLAPRETAKSPTKLLCTFGSRELLRCPGLEEDANLRQIAPTLAKPHLDSADAKPLSNQQVVQAACGWPCQTTWPDDGSTFSVTLYDACHAMLGSLLGFSIRYRTSALPLVRTIHKAQSMRCSFAHHTVRPYCNGLSSAPAKSTVYSSPVTRMYHSSMHRGLCKHHSRPGALHQGYGWQQLRPPILWHGFCSGRREEEEDT